MPTVYSLQFLPTPMPTKLRRSASGAGARRHRLRLDRQHGHAVSADHEGGGAADKLLHWDAPSAGLSQPALRFRPLAVGEHVGGRPLVLFERHYEVRFNPKQYLRTNLSGASNREGGDGILQGQR